jgi:protein-L-isoaspartate(D-aspartate) O-methyltransferase
MVEAQLERRGIADQRVLAAMREVPREEFVPERYRGEAYADEPIAIGYGQTISQPYMVALMAERLQLTGREVTLEVGAGCGYAAAVLGRLAWRVVTVELIPELAALAQSNLRRTGLDGNVIVVPGDGSLGCAAFAPYDAIAVAAGAPEIPAALLEQLNDPGRLVIPVGERDDQELRVVQKCGGRIEERVATMCRFVLLRGGEGWK